MTNSKYRGICKDGEGFVYGPLVNLFGKVWIADLARESDAKDMAETLGGIYTNMAGQLLTEVLPETVGMFTNKHDIHGNEAYDGDLIALPGRETSMRIVWDNKIAGFGKQRTTDSSTVIHSGLEDFNLEWEVTGNIHQTNETL